MSERRAALVLAAGKGTRLYSTSPKVLRTLLGEPMLHYVYQALEPFFGEDIHTVVGFGADEVRQAFPDKADKFVLQAEQLGTGHAVQVAWQAVVDSGAEAVCIVNGDVPLMGHAPLEGFLEALQELGADIGIMTVSPRDPGAYGRVIRNESGYVQAVIEAKDFDPEQHGQPSGEVNAGVYYLKTETMGVLLNDLKNDNASGEYYLTDLVAEAVKYQRMVIGYNCGADPYLMGVNTPKELAHSEFILRKLITNQWLDAGAVLHNPESVVIGPRVELAPGAELFGPCELYGTTSVAAGAQVRSHTVLYDSAVAENALVREFSHLDQAQVGPDCVVGPFARLRPGAVLEREAKVGNFCEIKKSRVGQGSKVNHLTYVGDSEIGRDVNIGAGTITCNYDGKNKHKTIIEDGVFIGSNTALVAPITVGKGALIGAGSVITKDVGPGELGVARTRQSNLKRKKTTS